MRRPPGADSAADSIVLAARPSAVGLARLMVAAAVRRWGLAGIAEESALIVSELVTNAVKATGSVADTLTWDQLRDVGMIKVQVARGDSCLMVEVWDSDPAALPELTDAPGEAESGRGLVLVDALSARWGHYRMRGGKVVWASVDVPPLPVTAAGLPQRARAQVEPYEPSMRYDRELLNRVYDGLRGL